jgi:hypothetical protein
VVNSQVNFTKYCKRSTTRDFRIHIDVLNRLEDEAEDESEQENLKVSVCFDSHSPAEPGRRRRTERETL